MHWDTAQIFSDIQIFTKDPLWKHELNLQKTWIIASLDENCPPRSQSLALWFRVLKEGKMRHCSLIFPLNSHLQCHSQYFFRLIKAPWRIYLGKCNNFLVPHFHNSCNSLIRHFIKIKNLYNMKSSTITSWVSSGGIENCVFLKIFSVF